MKRIVSRLLVLTRVAPVAALEVRTEGAPRAEKGTATGLPRRRTRTTTESCVSGTRPRHRAWITRGSVTAESAVS